LKAWLFRGPGLPGGILAEHPVRIGRRAGPDRTPAWLLVSPASRFLINGSPAFSKGSAHGTDNSVR
jgi:hypothetical protein